VGQGETGAWELDVPLNVPRRDVSHFSRLPSFKRGNGEEPGGGESGKRKIDENYNRKRKIKKMESRKKKERNNPKERSNRGVGGSNYELNAESEDQKKAQERRGVDRIAGRSERALDQSKRRQWWKPETIELNHGVRGY